MHRYLNFKASFRHFVVLAISSAALVILFVAPAKGQGLAKDKTKTQPQIWDVTINVTSGDTVYEVVPDQMKYKFLCTFAAGDEPASPTVLRVCPGDVVQWHAKTQPDSDKKLKSQMVVICEEDLILNNQNNIAHTFKAKDGATDGGPIDTGASSDVPHEYSVFIFDKVTKQVFIDDPKIIIGTGTVIEALNEIETGCDKLEHQLRDNLDAELKAKKLCKEIRALKDQLQAK